MNHGGPLALWNEKKDIHIFNIHYVHFHSPSEHTLNGTHYDLEMHIVHKDEYTGETAVLCVFFDTKATGNHSRFISDVHPDFIPYEMNSQFFNELISEIDHSSILYYRGSLTTPPCTENVNWIIIS